MQLCFLLCRKKRRLGTNPFDGNTEAQSIGALYGIEAEIRGKPPDERRAIRQDRAAPLLADLRAWMEKTVRSLSPKSETAAAIRYALSRWRALTRYVDDGRIEIDNSAAERALRAVALAWKNYCSADKAAARAQLPSTPWRDALSQFRIALALNVPRHPQRRTN